MQARWPAKAAAPRFRCSRPRHPRVPDHGNHSFALSSPAPPTRHLPNAAPARTTLLQRHHTVLLRKQEPRAHGQSTSATARPSFQRHHGPSLGTSGTDHRPVPTTGDPLGNLEPPFHREPPSPKIADHLPPPAPNMTARARPPPDTQNGGGAPGATPVHARSYSVAPAQAALARDWRLRSFESSQRLRRRIVLGVTSTISSSSI